MFAVYNKPLAWRRLVLFALLGIISVSAQTGPESWGIAIQHDSNRGTDPLRFQLALVEGDPLVGTFAADTLPPDESAKKIPSVAIEGHEKSDGTFWPLVELQVKTPDGKWLKIASSPEEAVSAKVTIYCGMTLHGLLVNLEPFRGYIGKCQFGRVLLKSGQEAKVNLDDLTDPSKRNQTKKSK